MRKRGFTLIEIIIAIAILGTIATIALPRYLDLRDTAEESVRNSTVAAIRDGIAIYHGKQIVSGATPAWPATLDSAPNGQCSSCFSNILQEPIDDDRWIKFGNWYSYVSNDSEYVLFFYNNSTGKFRIFTPSP